MGVDEDAVKEELDEAKGAERSAARLDRSGDHAPNEPAESSRARPIDPANPRVCGRYELHGEIAAGGMGTVHLGRLLGDAGFARPVAIKRLHPHLAHEREFVRMFVDEARLASRVRHPNVVQTLDVVRGGDELFLVMEYVHGAPLSALLGAVQRGKRELPLRIVSSIMSNVLHGLHAAHEAKDEHGVALCIVHRDVSPHNVLVGADGVSRLHDFGVLKARGRLTITDGSGGSVLKGKLGYIPPEQLRNDEVSRLADVYAASVVLWEMLAGRRLYTGESEANVIEQILVGLAPPPSKYHPSVPAELDALVLRGLDPDPNRRFPTARAMAMELERIVAPAPAMEVGLVVEQLAGELLARRLALVTDIERLALPGHDASSQHLPVALVAGGSNERSSPSTPSAPHTTNGAPRGDHAIVEGHALEQPRRRAKGAVVLFALLGLSGLAWIGARMPSWLGARSDASFEVNEPAPARPFSSEGASSPTSSIASAPLEWIDPAPKGPSGVVKKKAHSVKSTTTSSSTSASSSTPSSASSAGGSGDPCAVPYWWDKDGVRHYKRDCLGKH